MSQWGYVALGWILTYVTLGVWYYTSRMPKTEDDTETQ
jgi:hypothetical protein